MPTTAPIKVPIRGIDKYSKAFNKMNAKVARMGRNVKAAGRKMTTGLTLPIVMFGASAIRSGIQFDDVMRKVQAKSGATVKDMAAIRTEAKKLGAETRWTAIQAGEGFDKLAMAGWNADDSLKAMRPTLNLAAAAGSEVALTADVMSDTMGAFRIEASRAEHVVDVMATTLTSANVDMETYKDSMKYVAPVAKEFGMSIEDASAAVGFLGNVGIKGSQSGTSLRKVMLALATATGPAAKELKKYGVDVEGSDGKIRRFIDIMGDMSGAFVEQGTSQKETLTSMKEIFGIKSITGAAAMASALKDGGGSLVKLTTALNKIQPGKAQAMADVMEGGAGGDWRAMVSAFEAMQIAFMETGMLEDLASIMKDLATWMREVSKEDPDTLKRYAKGLAVIAALGPALMITGNALIVFSTLSKLSGPTGAIGRLSASLFGLSKNATSATTALGGATKAAPKLGAATARMGPMVGIATVAFIALGVAMDNIAKAEKRLVVLESLRDKMRVASEKGIGGSKSLEEKREALADLEKLQSKAARKVDEGSTFTEALSNIFTPGTTDEAKARIGSWELAVTKVKNMQAEIDREVARISDHEYGTSEDPALKYAGGQRGGGESKITIDFSGLPEGVTPTVTNQKGAKVAVKDNGAIMESPL